MTKIAFQFSGGKDSTAALFFMQDHWKDLHFYTLDSGDMFPETKDFIRMVAAMLPNHTWVPGQQAATIARWGPPADVIPVHTSAQSHMVGLRLGHPLQNRLDCCARSKMAPLHDRMRADGITHIMRGQRNEDTQKGPLHHGQSDGEFTVLYPIETWTEREVWDYLDNLGMRPPLYAEGVRRSGDCMTCSAWLGDDRPTYLKKHHPEKARILSERLTIIESETRRLHEALWDAQYALDDPI